MSRTVFRCAVGTQVFAWAVIAGGVVAIAGLVAMLVSGLGIFALVIALIVMAVLGIIYLWLVALHPKIVVDDRIHVINPLHRHIFEPREIRSVDPGPNGLVIRHGGGTVEAWAVQKGTRKLRRRIPARADQVAATLLALIRERVDPAAAPLSPPSSPESPATVVLGSVRDEPASPLSPDTTILPAPRAASPATPAPTLAGPADPHSPADSLSPASPPTPVSPPAWATLEQETDPVPELEEPEHDDGPDREDEEDDLIIRRARDDDHATLVELEQQIVGGTGGGPWWDEVLHDRTYKVRIAELDGEPVGYLCYDADELHRLGLVSTRSSLANSQLVLDYALDEMAMRGTAVATVRLTDHSQRERYRELGWTDSAASGPDELVLTCDLADRV